MDCGPSFGRLGHLLTSCTFTVDCQACVDEVNFWEPPYWPGCQEDVGEV